MGFIDIHCHVLPGIDDGAKDLRQSIEMLNIAVADGIEVMLATPHILPGVFDNTPQAIRHSYKLLCREISAQQLPLRLYYAAEVHLCPEIMLWHKQQRLPFLGRYQGKEVLLLELPHAHVPQGFNNVIKWLTARNITPLIAHPERNRGVWKEINLLSQWRRLGCLFQVTAGSLLGEFRQSAEDTALQMLQSDLVDVVASDCHGLDKRPPNLSQAYHKVSALCGQPRAQRLFIDTPGLFAATCQGRLASTETSLVEPAIFRHNA